MHLRPRTPPSTSEVAIRQASQAGGTSDCAVVCRPSKAPPKRDRLEIGETSEGATFCACLEAKLSGPTARRVLNAVDQSDLSVHYPGRFAPTNSAIHKRGGSPPSISSRWNERLCRCVSPKAQLCVPPKLVVCPSKAAPPKLPLSPQSCPPMLKLRCVARRRPVSDGGALKNLSIRFKCIFKSALHFAP